MEGTLVPIGSVTPELMHVEPTCRIRLDVASHRHVNPLQPVDILSCVRPLGFRAHLIREH